MDIELTDPEELKTLLALKPKRRPTRPLAEPGPLAPRWVDPRQGRRAPSRPRCACGKCKACVSNARWEAKYGDPDYYRPRPMAGRSPFSDL